MKRWRGYRRAFLAARPVLRGRWPAAAAVFLGPGLATADIPSAEDPPGVARFPDAAIVAFSRADLRAYEFVTGRVERSRRERRIDRSVRVPANLLRVTYRTPPGTPLRDVVAHYRGEVAGFAEVFACQGLDCGRSTAWANDVFRVKELVAPDSAQFYLAVAGEDAVAAIYIVQRGNRRVYAHVDFAQGDGIGARALGGAAGGHVEDAERSTADSVGEALRSQRYAVLPGAAPDDAGRLGRAALEALDAAAPELAGLETAVYVVCHVDQDGDAETAIARSAQCAKQAALRLRAAGVEAAPFGAGPLLPRPDAPPRRLELVLP